MRANCLLAIATKTGQVMRIVVQCPGIDGCHGGIFFLTSLLRTKPGRLLDMAALGSLFSINLCLALLARSSSSLHYVLICLCNGQPLHSF
jgi:hypothetical protein